MARVTGYGRVTIPLRVRDVLGVKEGDYVRLSLIEVVKKREREGVGGVAGRKLKSER